MSYTWRSRLPLDIFFPIIDVVDNHDDLLALALTCHTICGIIVPHYISYFRISSMIMDTDLWEHLSQKLPTCKNTRELELTDAKVPRFYCVPSFQREKKWARTLVSEPIMTPNPWEVIRHMPNLRRVSLSWTTDLDPFRDILAALIDSKCRLEELDLSVQISNDRRFPNLSNDAILLTEKTKLQKLQFWSNLDLTTMRKFSIELNRRQCHALGELTYINTTLSKAQALTHLNLTMNHAALENFLECTWPSLENLVISSNINVLPKDDCQNPMNLTNFFSRHPKLAVLSLPSNIYLPHILPYVTVENLPALISFSYNAPIQVPISKVLSIASARRLRHLTINEKDASLIFSDRDVYKELTFLQTCCITAESRSLIDYKDVNRILESFVAHVTNLQKIHLPVHGNFKDVHFETLSLLQCLPNLTHLSGGFTHSATQQEMLSQELYQFYRLKYLISPLLSVGSRKPFQVYELTRDRKKRCVLFETVSENHAEYDVGTWGNFYKRT